MNQSTLNWDIVVYVKHPHERSWMEAAIFHTNHQDKTKAERIAQKAVARLQRPYVSYNLRKLGKPAVTRCCTIEEIRAFCGAISQDREYT